MSTIFSGCYRHFDDLPHADDYNQLNVSQCVYEAARTRYESTSFFPEPLANEYNHIRDITALCITFLCAETDKTIRILDIGGGFGVSFVELIKRAQLRNFDYTVYEIHRFVSYYRADPFFKESNITILENIEAVTGQFDLLILGSSLQYFPDTAFAIQQFVHSAQHPNYIVLTHTPVTKNPSFVTAQVNVDQKNIPSWIFNIDALITLFKEMNYLCIYKSAIYRENLFDDFYGADQQYRSANLMFKKVIQK